MMAHRPRSAGEGEEGRGVLDGASSRGSPGNAEDPGTYR
jgi:hypothetical protein